MSFKPANLGKPNIVKCKNPIFGRYITKFLKMGGWGCTKISYVKLHQATHNLVV